MRVIIACEFSGIVREAFHKHGHDVWSCDLLPTEIPGQHIHGDIFEHLNSVGQNYYDLLIGHPECTYITNSGVRWLYNDDGSYNDDRWNKMLDACDFFNALKSYTKRWVLENPIPHKYAREIIGYYDQLIQPWQFGHTTSKATCLWLNNVPPLIYTQIVPEQKRTYEIHTEPPGPDRKKNRSRTFHGIADAMAEQWSNI